MTQAPNIFLTARTQLDRLALGQVSAADLLEEHVARYEVTNAAVNAVVRTDLAAARTRALELDRLLQSGIPAGPLHGLPMTIKDTFDVDGMPATAGAPEYANRPSRTADAAAVALLRKAGAVVIAKTNMHELAFGISGYNPTFQTGPEPGVRNAYDIAMAASRVGWPADGRSGSRDSGWSTRPCSPGQPRTSAR